MSMRWAWIRTCHIIFYLAQLAGGYDRVRFSRKDLNNRITTYEQVVLADGDASRVTSYLSYKVEIELGFFGKYSFDEY